MKRTALFHKAILVALFSFLSISISASKYYASPNGTGSGADYDNPCSFATGYSLINTPGDTLFLKGGQYDLSVKTNLNKIGTDVARICIFACPGETPIFDFRNEAYGQAGFSFNAGASFMHIKGWVVRYAGDNGIINNGNNIIIENCTFYGNCDTGLQHKEGGGNLIKNCDSYNNFDYQTGGITLADFGGNADGFADKQFSNANPNTYEGCRAWNNSDDGWDFFQRVGDIKIKNCICYNNGPATFNMTNHPRALTDAAWFSQFPKSVTNADGGTDNITLASYINYGNGNGFKLGGDYTACNSEVTNCLSVGNTVRGFDQNNNAGKMEIYNCSAYNNGINFGFGNSSYGTLVIKNSMSLSTKAANQFSAKTTTNINNSWNTTGVTCTTADFISLDSTTILSPRQADGSLAINDFLRLVDGSDLINTGLILTYPYSGAAPDLGCYEKGTIDQFPATVSAPTNKTQTIIEGSAISSIVFTWGASATGLTASGLPAGITTTLDNTAKTLTLSGTPTETGVFNYTVSTIGGSGTPATITGKIVISSGTGKRIAYFTLPNNVSDEAILNRLYGNPDFSVTIIDAATTSVDYSSYDMILISPAPATGTYTANFNAIETQNKPMLLLKPFALKSTLWDWGTAVDLPSITTVTIGSKTHEIFTGLSFTGTNNDELVLFTSLLSTKGVTGITATSWKATPSVNTLGYPKGNTTTNSIVEIPVGTNMNGINTTQKFIMIGVSEASTANLTPSATKLIENACYYLMGMTVPTTSINENNHTLDFKLIKNNNTLHIESEYQICQIEIYNTSGILVASERNTSTIDIKSLPTGLYITNVCSKQAGCASVKFIKE